MSIFYNVWWFVSMHTFQIRHENHVFVLSQKSWFFVKRHFKILLLAIKSNLKGFSHFFLMKHFNFSKIDSTLELNESRFHSWNCFFEIRQKRGMKKFTCASSCNHKSTYFVIFVFIHLLSFTLKGNTSYFEIL